MHVAVAIVGFRNPEDIARCLSGLDASSYHDFEVLICENGGAEAFAELAERLPGALAAGQPVKAVLAPGNLGFAGGVNVCLANTPDADAWWVLNPDTCPEPGALAGMVEKMTDGPYDAVGCTLRLPDNTIQSYGGHWNSWLARAVSIGHGNALSVAVDEADIERRQNYLNGASMLIGAQFLRTIGPMREDYFLYAEEIEWCLRGKMSGMILGFASTVSVIHYQGTTTGSRSAAKLPVYLGERNKMLLTRDLYPFRLPIAAVMAAVICTVRFARRRAWRQIGYGLSGLLAGLMNRRGPPDWVGV